MTNEPSWLRTYIGDLAREAGLIEPTETDPGLYGVAGPTYIETLGRIFIPVDTSEDREAEQAGPDEAWKTQIDAMMFPVHSEVDTSKLKPASPTPIRIDEMTLADYRRGIANMKTRYV